MAVNGILNVAIGFEQNLYHFIIKIWYVLVAFLGELGKGLVHWHNTI